MPYSTHNFDASYMHICNTAPALNYTVSKKTSDMLSAITCHILTNFQIKNFFTARKPMKFATEIFSMSHHTLHMLLHYLEKLKVQIC